MCYLTDVFDTLSDTDKNVEYVKQKVLSSFNARKDPEDSLALSSQVQNMHQFNQNSSRYTNQPASSSSSSRPYSRGFHRRPRGPRYHNYNNQRQYSSDSQTKCQLCIKPNHTAPECYSLPSNYRIPTIRFQRPKSIPRIQK